MNFMSDLIKRLKAWHIRRRLLEATRIYRDSELWHKDILDSIHLNSPKLYRPSADGQKLILWNKMCENKQAHCPSDLSAALLKTVVTNEFSISDFDISKLQSLTHSKGFGEHHFPKINGSWFADLASWGKGMYPDKQLSGLDDFDWKNNIQHVEREAFGRSQPVRVNYYAWINRYVGHQSGGSHHTAMLIHQMVAQERIYKREAKVRNYSLDLIPLSSLKEHYSMFVANRDAYCSKLESKRQDLFTILRQVVASEVYVLPISGDNHENLAFFIPYSALAVSKTAFDTWYCSNAERLKIIPLIHFMSNTLKYCTSPYSHELEQIYLGDPRRDSDIYAKKHRNALL